MEDDKVEPIAIIGMHSKFPEEATSAQGFWEMLCDARNVATEAPSGRFNINGFYHPDPARLDAIRVRHAHYLKEDPRGFDAAFFTMSPAEASIVDPQQRCLLEGSYQTFENAGMPIERIAGTKTSVYCASFGRDQDTIFARDPEYQSRYQATATGSTLLSNRISHFFDLRGPSLTIDTACSSGLYAFHLACQSILVGESSMALVCGSNTCLTPEGITVVLDNASFLSADGRCYSFDHRANGYGRGEGFGFLLLKALSAALRDGDCIRAVVRGTGANQDGRTPSVTQPSPTAQKALIEDTYRWAGLDYGSTEFVEAHGTGTLVGDPIEANAIGHVFGPQRTRPLYVGSVKSNVGHLEGASGIAGVIKMVLALEKGIIPPNADFQQINPAIDLDELRLKIPRVPTPWPSTGIRRGSVSSFGYGGSNAHVILDDACNYLHVRGLEGVHQSTDLRAHTNEPPNGVSNGVINGSSNGTNDANDVNEESGNNHKSYAILNFSAQDQEGPQRQADALQAYLSSTNATHDNTRFLHDLTHTLSSCRSILNWRSFAMVESCSNSISDVAATLSESVFTLQSKPLSVIFVFTGQGAQYARMATSLCCYDVFEQAIEACDRYLETSLGCTWSAVAELEKSEDLSRVSDPELSQPLCTAVQLALIDLLRSWNITPASVCGHSSGEIAAAYCAGAITRESAWKIAYFRGVLAAKLSHDNTDNPTTMMSVGLSEQEMVAYLDQESGVTVACINSPINTTVSGPVRLIDELYKRLDKDEIFARKLNTGLGYHSNVMQQVATEYKACLSDLETPPTSKHDSRVVMYSSVSGQAIDLRSLREPEYWVKNLVSPVRFAPALTQFVEDDEFKKRDKFFVEIGPQASLRRPVQDTLTGVLGKKGNKWHYASALQGNGSDDLPSILNMAGQLWSHGSQLNLTRVNRDSIGGQNREAKLVVDLPSYPFSRATWHWDESRLSRNYAFRPYRRHALLGIREKDWNPGEASWKNQLRVEENPWLEDHALNGNPIFPGSGMLTMAIEAVRQLAEPHRDRIEGYRLNSVRMVRPINVDMSERGTEAKIHLRPRKALLSSNDQLPWYDFRIYGMSDDGQWTECAFGGVKVELVSEQLPDDRRDAARIRQSHFRQDLEREYRQNALKCTLTAHHQQFYRNIAQNSGFEYGPYFSLLRDITYDRSGHVTATLALRAYAQRMQFAGEDPCVIHPTTLDALCQAQMVGLSKGGWHRIPTMMFTHLDELWVSHALFKEPKNPNLCVASKETTRGFRECMVRTVALFADTMEPAVVLDGQRGTAITSLANTTTLDTEATGHMSYTVEFRPRVPLLTMDEMKQYLNQNSDDRRRNVAEDYARTDRSDAIMFHYAEQTVKSIDECAALPWDQNHFFERYLNFLRGVAANKQKWWRADDVSIQRLREEASQDPGQELNMKVGEHLEQILGGKANALQIIFEDDLADAFYHSELTSALNRRIGAYVQILSHTSTQLRILEIGAGTGSSTAKILPYLVHHLGCGQQSVRFAEYMYTDISAGFFEKARERFSAVVGPMQFKKLDIESDPTAQGFQEGSYDLIIAGNVLHATADPNQALRNARKLLRSGGSLAMAELTNLESMRHVFVFGLLPGWWLRGGPDPNAVDSIDQGPLLSEQQWDLAFQEAGFSGLQIAFRDFEDPLYHQVSILITTVPGTEQQQIVSEGGCVVLVDSACAEQQYLAKAIANRLGPVCQIVDFKSLEDGKVQTDLCGQIAIILPELTRPLLAEATASEFAVITKLSQDCKLLLWLTTGGGPKAANPDAEVSVGFGRTVCSERADQCFVNLSLEQPFDAPKSADTIVRVLHDALAGDSIARETEYTEIDSLIHIPRLVPTGGLNDVLVAKSKPPEVQPYVMGSNGAKPHFYLTIQTPGLLDTLYYAEDESSEEAIKPGHSEVEIKVGGLNFRDVMIALGGVPGNSFGCDGAGIVSRSGPGSKFQAGDRVICCSNDGKGFGTFARYLDQDLMLIPDKMSFQVAAAISAVWRTAVYSLDYIAHLGRQKSILIHSGAGGVGQAAIQLAKLRGAEPIFVTVGSELKRQLVRSTYGIPDSQIFYSRDSSFHDDVLHATGGRGVDVVLNSLGGELLKHSWECIAPLGCFVDIGKGDAILNNDLPMGPFSRNVHFACVDLSLVSRVAPSLMTQIMNDVLKLFEQYPELHEPFPLHTYPPAQVEEAFRYVQSGRNTGKVLVDYETSGNEISYQPVVKSAYSFPAQATYVLPGGLGGLGREITRWMVSRGAKHFLLLNRSGSSVDGAEDFLKEIKALGARVLAPPCDVSDRKALESALKEASGQDFPPVKGCIQGALVLDDDPVATISVNQFHNALRPKRSASWNLHELLPADLDFFVMLSSFCGIFGNPGQSNYAAGGTYEDALARYRLARGHKGVSIDLALVAEAGWASDNYERVAANLRTYGALHNAQLMTLLDVVCDPAYDGHAHIVTVMDRPEQIYNLASEGRIVWPTKPLFRHLLRIGEVQATSATTTSSSAVDEGSQVDYLAMLRNAPSAEDAAECVVQGLVQKLSKTLSVPPESLDISKPAFVLGVDSLIAVEIRYWFTKNLAVEVPVFTIMKNQSVVDLCSAVAQMALNK